MQIVLAVIWFSLALQLVAAADKCPVLEESGISNTSLFLDEREAQVKLIAQFALQNYQQLENPSALTACNSDTVCSRATCRPLQRDLAENELTCEAIPNNPICVGRDNSTCTTALVSRARSYVWLSANAYAMNSALDCDMSATICAQQNLDKQVFIPSGPLTNITFNLQGFIRFGSNNGILRNYPGQEVTETTCSTYDLRKRLWYVGATSVQKEIVVLLDRGQKLGTVLNAASGIKLFNYSRTVTTEFLDTLSPGDKVSVYTFGSSSSEATSFVGQVTVNSNKYSVDDPEVQLGLREIVSNISDPDIQSSTTANLTSGLLEALNQFNSSTNQLKVIIILTAGDLSGDDLEPSLIQNMTALNVRVFIYRYLGAAVGSGNDSVTAMLQNISCNLGGWYEEAIYSDQNPLGFLQSFYSYVAKLRFSLTGQDQPFWVPSHNSPAAIGPLISVSYPVFYNDTDTFLGVASVDIIVNRFLDQAGNGNVDTLLQMRNTLNSLPLDSPPTTIPCGKKLAQNLPLALQNSSSCTAILPSGATGLCTSDVESNADKNMVLKQRSCCDNCCPGQHKSNALSGGQLAGVVIGSSAIGIILALLFCCVFWKLWLPTNSEQGPSPSLGESSPQGLTTGPSSAYKWDDQL